MERWKPPVRRSKREEQLLKLAGKSRKLLVFLGERRREIFDDGFQEELELMYRDSGQGEQPQPPARPRAPREPAGSPRPISRRPKNLFDLGRLAVVQNLETVNRRERIRRAA